ncbi:hypothetical protein E4T56_gene20599 [Termitomyces sp. T112]|nr:hypothetical protein E4T56_gene20599 [Termitomyces sp. T112]
MVSLGQVFLTEETPLPENAPMEVNTDLFTGLTPKANLTMDKGLPTSGTQSTPTLHPNTAILMSFNINGMQIASQMEPDL